MQQFVKFVHRNLIRRCAVLLWFASGFVREAREYGIAMLFAKRAAIRRMRHIFMVKSAVSLDCGTLQDGTAVRPSKYGTHGGKKAVHMRRVFKCAACLLHCF